MKGNCLKMCENPAHPKTKTNYNRILKNCGISGD